MDKHFITDIKINKLRHLENIDIQIDKDKRKHLLLTGKNGVGKTTLLNCIRDYLKAIQDDQIEARVKGGYDLIKAFKKETKHTNDISIIEQRKRDIKYDENCIKQYGGGIELSFSRYEDLGSCYKNSNFIIAYYGDNRRIEVEIPHGVEEVKLQPYYSIEANPSKNFVKYLLDLKTQQSFARNENDMDIVDNIESWFNRFEKALQNILDDKSVKLKFDYKHYTFEIIQDGREPYGFNELSSGYSSIINIISDLILRMDRNRASEDKSYGFDIEGIVLIDEIETHLHIALQKKILPFLTEFFPNIQFIISTHSPFVLNSVDDAVVYDLEKKIRLDDLSGYSYDGIVEGYFDVDNYSNELKQKINEYRNLAFKSDLSEDEKARRAELRIELKNACSDLAEEVKLEFSEIETKRKELIDKNK